MARSRSTQSRGCRRRRDERRALPDLATPSRNERRLRSRGRGFVGVTYLSLLFPAFSTDHCYYVVDAHPRPRIASRPPPRPLLSPHTALPQLCTYAHSDLQYRAVSYPDFTRCRIRYVVLHVIVVSYDLSYRIRIEPVRGSGLRRVLYTLQSSRLN